MQAHHYLGALPKIGRTIWYVARLQEKWVALLSISAPALKCAARDQWIGWDFRHQYDRLHLVVNNSRFLILPDCHAPNLASRLLSLCEKRIVKDWQDHFNCPVLLLETFVDPRYFRGTIYRAANWLYVGQTRGFRRIQGGYSQTPQAPKLVFVRALIDNIQLRLSQPILDPQYHHGVPRIMLSAQNMRSLPEFFYHIPDPRRGQGRRHPLPAVLAIATAATLCGMRGYKAIAEWAQDLGQKARGRLGCRWHRQTRRYLVPSVYVIRDLLVRIDPDQLDLALQQWNAVYSAVDESLAIDGKTMCNAIDGSGRQTHIMSVVGHRSLTCYTQKKSGQSR
jgi:hypothetical protein